MIIVIPRFWVRPSVPPATIRIHPGVLNNMNTMTQRMTIAFETALGRCAVRWTDPGITSVLLPSQRLDALPVWDGGDLPPFVHDAIEGMTAVLAGEPRDLRGIPLDQRRIDAFRREVYAATCDIEPGRRAATVRSRERSGVRVARGTSVRLWPPTPRRSSSRVIGSSRRTVR